MKKIQLSKRGKFIVAGVAVATALVITITMLLIFLLKSPEDPSTTYSFNNGAINQKFIKYDNGNWEYVYGSTAPNGQSSRMTLTGTWGTDANGNDVFKEVSPKFTSKLFFFDHPEMDSTITDHSLAKGFAENSYMFENYIIINSYADPTYAIGKLVKEGIAAEDVACVVPNGDHEENHSFALDGYHFKLPVQSTNLSLNRLLSEIKFGFDVTYGDFRKEIIASSIVISASEFDQTKPGIHEVTFSYYQNGDNTVAAKEIKAKIFVEDKTESINGYIDLPSSGFKFELGASEETLFAEIFEYNRGKFSYDNQRIDLTPEMISGNFDSSKEGIFDMTFTYKTFSKDFIVQIIDSANIKDATVDAIMGEPFVLKGTPLTIPFWSINFSDGSRINPHMPEGRDFTASFEVDGVEMNATELTATTGFKKFTLVLKRAEETYKTNGNLNIYVYDETDKIVSNMACQLDFTDENNMGFAVSEDGTIDFGTSSIIVFYNGSSPSYDGALDGLTEGVDYVKVAITKDMLKNYTVLNNRIDIKSDSDVHLEYTPTKFAFGRTYQIPAVEAQRN